MPDKLTLDEQAMLDRERRNLWVAIQRIERRMAEYDMGGFAVMKITIESPLATGGNWRGIIKGQTETGAKSIAFCNAEGVQELLKAIDTGANGDTLRWKEDVPYDQRKALGKK